jgi:trimeric autotransporter adhesin
MPKVKISEFDIDPANNTDINSINIAEGCAPSGINNAIRQLMSDLKEFQTGGAGDPFNGAVNGTVGATTANTGAFTTLSASGVTTVSAGTVSAPAITTTGDTNTGIFFPAADTIAFSEGGVESMRITSAGNVGIGTASPQSALQISGAMSAAPTGLGVHAGVQSDFAVIQLNGDAATGSIIDFSQSGTDYLGRILYSNSTNAMVFSTNNAERMRIDSSGNVGIGTSSPATKLDVSGNLRFSAANPAIELNNGGPQVYSTVSNTLQFATGGGIGSATERMRINSGGQLIVGGTTANGAITGDAGSTSGSSGLASRGGGSGSSGGQIQMTNTYAGVTNPNKSLRVNNSGEFEIVNSAYSAVILALTNGGAAYNLTGTWGTLSDERVKENIQDSRGYLDDLCKLRVVKYSLKSEESQTPTKLGFIAQEVEQVFPNMIEESLNTFGDLEKIKQVKISVLTPMLVKALQEQQAIITDLKARIEAIESK